MPVVDNYRVPNTIMEEADSTVRPVDDNEPLLDLEASPLQGQLASAVLDARNGKLVRGSLPQPEDATILFEMLSEVGSLPQQQLCSSFRRLTVSFPSRNFRYVLSRDATHIYIAQVKSMP